MPESEKFNNETPLSKPKIAESVAGQQEDKRPELSEQYSISPDGIAENIKRDNFTEYIERLDNYLKKLDYAVEGGKSDDSLYLLTESELVANVNLLTNLAQNVRRQSNEFLVAKWHQELSAPERARAAELLDFLKIIKQRRETMIKIFSDVENFSDEVVWRQTHIMKDRFSEIILNELNIYDSGSLYLERALFDLSRPARD